MLTEIQKGEFIEKGFIKIENAFPAETAADARKILWAATGCDAEDRSTWIKPVIRLGYFGQAAFQIAANTPQLYEAFDELAGAGRWVPRNDLGSFPVRFPSDEDPQDTGWHIDASFPGADPDDYMSYRVNIYSKGRAFLMLFLFSDIGEDDAPTRIRVGSHLKVAEILEPYGDAGLPFAEISRIAEKATREYPEVNATGKAGTVYLCHPFIIHAAQAHHGDNPRFLAQPPLHLKSDLQPDRKDGDYSPLELSIRKAIKILFL